MRYMGHVERGFFMALFSLGCFIGICINTVFLLFGWPLALLSLLTRDDDEPIKPIKMNQEAVEIVAMYQTGMLVRAIAQERRQEESTIRRILAEHTGRQAEGFI
ncbi:hypothetical protein LCGC14_2027510 [marine sediment metagenome]|uniref:Uncharacterized protein n=1 Tax=marine sediment metagenome TaxID=412755 RepID=A0A0F9H939_9ZZZZ